MQPIIERHAFAIVNILGLLAFAWFLFVQAPKMQEQFIDNSLLTQAASK